MEEKKIKEKTGHSPRKERKRKNSFINGAVDNRVFRVVLPKLLCRIILSAGFYDSDEKWTEFVSLVKTYIWRFLRDYESRGD